jgi:rubrerythrin
MGLFSLDEIFQMAMQAEETGRLLYEAVAKEASDPRVADLCRKLAAQEARHYGRFKAIKEAQPERNSRRLSLEEMDFVDGLMRGRVTPLEAEAKRVARENSLGKVLNLAIQAETDSAAFYEQILPAVDAVEAKAIREIIEEEKRHYRVLSEYRQEIKD